MSFLKKLFGGGSGKASSGPVSDFIHEGFNVQTTPMKEGDQYRLCAKISKELNGEIKTHTLIRADIFASSDQASDAAIIKAKQVIKEQGERIFG